MEGFAAPEFERVAETFERETAAAGEEGAAMAMTVEGEVVVDVWRGEFKKDSLVCIFSCTKGLTALVVQRLVERGLLDVDAPVAAYWPEFAANGKEGVLVRHVLNHTAGVLSFPDYWEVALDDHAGVCAGLAASAPSWPPGTAFGYHAHTYGYLLGELVRRVDGRTLGRLFAEEIATPNGLDLYIGLPPELDARVVDSKPPPEGAPDLSGIAEEDVAAWYAALFTPPDVPDATAWLAHLMNRPEIRRAELPSGNGIGDARSLARMYVPLALDPPARFIEPQAFPDGTATGMGLGYALFDGGRFGHTGAGGNIGLADPAKRRTYAYVKNRMLYNGEVGWKPLLAC